MPKQRLINGNMHIKDDKIYKLLKERGEFVLQGREIAQKQDDLKKEFESAGEELNKFSIKINQINEKVKALLDKHKIETKEFEVIQEIRLGEGDELEIVIVDQIEEYKNYLRTQKEKENKVK